MPPKTRGPQPSKGLCGGFRLSVLMVLMVLAGCGRLFPSNAIDPTGSLTRKDYQGLHERGPERLGAEKTSKARAEGQEPPIPALPVAVSPPTPEPLVRAGGASAQLGPKGAFKRVSVTVTEDAPLRNIFLDLARAGGFNLEMDTRVQGHVVFSAHHEPLGEVVERLCAAAGLRARFEGRFLRIEADDPYPQTYPVDYLNLTRRASNEISISTNVFESDVGGAGSSGGASGSGRTDNTSQSKVVGTTQADFWAEMENSLTQVLAGTASLSTAANAGPSAAPRLSVDRQAGLVTVLGTSRQHAAVRAYLKDLARRSSAQVLIEARIVEVQLDEGFESGINWRTLFNGSLNTAARFGTVGAGAPFSTATTAADGMFTASVGKSDFNGILNLVRSFGTTRILSSPRLTVLNNQTAVLKVARNEVYFLTSAQFPTTVTAGGVPISGTPVFSSSPRTVPVGLVMTVQPAINTEDNDIALTLRPTISRIVAYAEDPSIGLNAAQANVTKPISSTVPVLAVREMDSVLRLHSGEVAVMGGLMQDSSINTEKGVPPFDTFPALGNLAKSRDNKGQTTELVILLRATIMDDATPDRADKDLYRRYNRDPRPLSWTPSNR